MLSGNTKLKEDTYPDRLCQSEFVQDWLSWTVHENRRQHSNRFPQQTMTPTTRKQSEKPGKIVSGGQTGVDRAALDVALALGIPHGGWCPKGRLAEDRLIPPQYQLTETDSTKYAVRTEKNVVDSDGTLILCRGQTSGGTELTRQLALEHAKPCLVVDLNRPLPVDDVYRWISESLIETLNIAGPRESQNTGISAQARQFLEGLLGKHPRLP